MRKKWMSLLLVLCLIVGMLPLAASAADQEESVSTREELESALQDSSVTKINLAANIDMGEDAWHPVVIDRDLIIDGQNHVISGLKVTDYALQSDGTGVAGTGSSCDYYSGFIGWNKKNLTINNLSFENAEVDINPLSKESTGSSILAVVVANNTGSLIYNDVTVTDSIVRGYTKVGILHGFTQGAGSFVANHCSIESSEVVLEADGTDPAAAFSGLIIGYDGNNRAKTNGIKLSGNTVSIDESVNWGNTPITSENGVTKAGSYGLTCDTYTHGSAGTNKVELVAQVGDYQYETLSDAITAASSEDTVTLLEDTDEGVTVSADKKVTLDLNGKTLSLDAQTMRVSGNLTVKDSTATAEPVVSADYETVSYEAGKIVYTGSGTAMIVQDGGSVTLLSGIVDASAAGTAIYANGNREPESSGNTQPVNTSVTISGGYVHSMEYGVGVAGRGAQVSVSAGVIAAEGNCAIGGNGTNSNERYDGDTTINITGGTIIGRMAQAFAQQGYIAVGIYHPQKGSMTISGGTIYADQGVGIAMRGGQLNFTSGSVISTGTVSGKVGDSKVSMNCYGIQVDGGSGYYDYDNCAVTISGTASVSSQENVASVIVTPEGDQNKISISGGYFSYDPSEYLAAGMATLPSDKSGYVFMVGDAPRTEVEPATGDPSVNMNGIDPSDKKTVEDAASSVDDNGSLAAAANSVLDKVTEQQIEDATAQYKESGIEGASEEDTVVNIFAQTYLEITPTEYKKEGDTPTLTMDITPMYRVVASTAESPEDIKVIGEVEQGETPNAVVLEGSEKTLGIQIMTITVTLPEVFQDKKVFIQHVGYEYSAMADEKGEITFTNPHGFSEFTFSTTSKAVAQIGETSYTSFQDAINHVKNGETIILLQDKLSATVSQAVSFKVESKGGATYTANLTPGTNYTMVKNEDGSYTFTYVPPTTPSGPSDGDEDEEQPEFPFTDVKTGSWYYNAIKYVYEHGIMAGTGATTFDPNVELTRAMAVQILYNLEGQPTVIGEATFTDTAAAGDWAVGAITWAEQHGIVAGMGDGTFAPKAMVTREQFAQMMYNYAEFKKYDVTKTGNLTQFPDGADVSSWAEIALGWANANGLISGHDDGRLDPQGTAIRAQAASILMNFDRNLAK